MAPRNNTLADTIHAVSPDLSVELITANALQRVRHIAELFPSSVQFFCFECRLSDSADNVDFFVAGGHELVEYLPAIPVALPAGIRQFWFEFDVKESRIATGLPSIFFTLPHEQSHSTHLEICKAALASCPFATAQTAKCLELLSASLPNDARIGHIGLMLSRRSDEVRIAIKIPNASVIDYLIAIQWPGDIKQLGSLVSTLSEMVDFMGLNFEVGEKISERIGVECHFNHQLQPWQDPDRWAVLLDFLISKGLCAKRKRDAVLALPKLLTERNSQLVQHLVVLSHLKVNYAISGPEAKAYFGLLKSNYQYR